MDQGHMGVEGPRQLQAGVRSLVGDWIVIDRNQDLLEAHPVSNITTEPSEECWLSPAAISRCDRSDVISGAN
jgi:hypothetical protein